MVIGKKFAWAHIPRTGGDITAELFQFTDGLMNHNLIIKADAGTQPEKEDTFNKRGINPELILALNMRKLPSFLMSWIVMCAGRLHEEESRCFGGGVWPRCGQPLPIPSRKQLFDRYESYGPAFFHEYYGWNFATLPDVLLKKYTDGYSIGHWIRLEYLKEDFLRFINSIETLGEQQIEAIRQYQYAVKQPFEYNHNTEDFFSASELQILYDNNPLWRDIENELYQEGK